MHCLVLHVIPRAINLPGYPETHNASRSIPLSESCPPHNVAVNSFAFDEWNGTAHEEQCDCIKYIGVTVSFEGFFVKKQFIFERC